MAFPEEYPGAFPVVILEVLTVETLEAFLEVLDLESRLQDHRKQEEDWGCFGSWYWAGVPVR